MRGLLWKKSDSPEDDDLRVGPSGRPGGRRAEVYYTTFRPFLDPGMKQNIMKTKGFGTFWGPEAEVSEPEPRALLGKEYNMKSAYVYRTFGDEGRQKQ